MPLAFIGENRTPPVFAFSMLPEAISTLVTTRHGTIFLMEKSIMAVEELLCFFSGGLVW
jgi:hypothetical protein